MVAVRVGLRLSLLFSLMVILSGCMEALHVDQGGSPSPSPQSIFENQTQPPIPTPTMPITSTPGGVAETANSVGSALETEVPTASSTTEPLPASATPTPTPTLPQQPTGMTPTTTSTATPIPPTPTPTPTVPTATPTPEVVIVPPTLPAVSYAERWRAQQNDRDVFEPPQPYTTTGSELWWYDPVNQQHVLLGSFAGDFEAQAQFELVGQDVSALEVAYHVNQSYGLTAISSSLIERIQAAGYDEWIDTYVILTPEVRPRQAF